MKTGFFETDITSPVGMEKPGGYGKAYAAARHDPLKARAAVFGDGDSRIAFVGVDTCVINRRTVVEAREQIEQRCGIAPMAEEFFRGSGLSYESLIELLEDIDELLSGRTADENYPVS